MLVPSGNNVATLLAKWDAGSEQAFVGKMNVEAVRLGLTHTHYDDASGLQPETVSTARDQVRLAMAALKVPTLINLMAVRQVSLPVAGTVRNLDALLGSDGVIGGKTGTTSEAGGCFVFVARRRVGRTQVTVIGAVLGQPAVPATERTFLDAVFHATRVLLDSVPGSFEPFTAVVDHRPFAHLMAPWTHSTVPVRLERVPALIGWPGQRAKIRILAARHLRAPVRAGQRVGTAIVAAGGQRVRVGLVAAGDVPAPSLGWRLSHP
jgi:D-alanyl-D-alanine carboxypeptidase (penicillin-binding protein 5/6)